MKNLIIALIFITNTLFAVTPGKVEYNKEVTQMWTVDSNTKIYLSNKYGKMDIKTWNKNVVDIKVIITVKAKIKKDADKVFERINIDFSRQNNNVKAQTIISKSKGFFSFFDWNSDDYTIDWVVYMPSSNTLKLENSYGNTNMGEMDGALDIDIKYGDFNLNKATGNVKLDISYGDADVDICNNATIRLKHGEFENKESENLKIQTKYSKLKIANTGNIDLDSKYDEIKIGIANNINIDTDYSDFEVDKVRNIKSKSSYTELEIGSVENSVDISAKYGEIDIKSIKNGFDIVKINSKYTDIDLDLDSDCTFNGEFAANYSDISVTKDFYVTNKRTESYKDILIGYQGDESSKSRIIIDSDRGDIEIK